MKKIEITWTDAYERYGWHTPEDSIESCKPLMLCKTVGFLLDEDDNQITVCHTYNPAMVMGCLHIPKGAIKKRK